MSTNRGYKLDLTNMEAQGHTHKHAHCSASCCLSTLLLEKVPFPAVCCF